MLLFIFLSVFTLLTVATIAPHSHTWQVLLADFGLSKKLPKGSRTATICGTIQYMAPELLNDEPYDHRIDWWSLGVCSYIMMTGRCVTFSPCCLR